MPLYIRDDGVDDLAEKVRKATGARTKTDAVREALQAHLDALDAEIPLVVKVKALRQRVARIGERDPTFDQKAFSDEMWGDTDVH